MFDVSFTELLVIGVVALVVIGPERLPKVARTLGHLVGRAQRYVNDVKSDIQREVELDELRKLKDTMQNAAQSVQSTLHDAESSFRQPLESLEQNTMSALKTDTTAETATADAAAATPESPQLQAAAAAAADYAKIEAAAQTPAVTLSDSPSALAHMQAAQPTAQPTQLEIDGVSATQAPLPLEVHASASTATPTPGSKT
jgi:sec-independent protein translocase protein TatB